MMHKAKIKAKFKDFYFSLVHHHHNHTSKVFCFSKISKDLVLFLLLILAKHLFLLFKF